MILQAGASSADVDFEKQILPIFKQHCFECHGDGNVEGELSLDSIASILRGGHTSSPMIATELSNSELYLRITSDSDGYRMPKEGASLGQQDVDTIAAWITKVSKLDSDQLRASSAGGLKSASASGRNVPTNSRRANSNEVESSQSIMLVVSSVVILALVGWLIFRFIAKLTQGSRFSENSGRWLALLATVIGAVTCLMLFALGYLYNRTNQLADENKSLKSKLQFHQPKLPPAIRVDRKNLPLPPHPLHPPRLGGRYYRGNDERSPHLFNGGFYRTATIDLHLVNSEGVRVKREDTIEDDLEIEIVIQRAPKATKELFSERVLNLISIKHFCQSIPGFERSLKFTVVEKEDLWKVRIPLPNRDRWKEGRARGMVYLMYGVQPGDQRLPRPHFGIRYDVQTDGDKISNESELWMGSLYTLGGRVLVPDEDRVLLDRWFDWRPIPVIEGEAATDPKLLGVEEHVGH